MITRDVCLVWLLIVSIARAGLDDKAMNEARSLRDRGEFEKATALLQSQIDQSSPPLVENERRATEFEIERIRRIRQDYPAKRESVLKKITDQAPGFTEAEFDEIEKAGKFDIMVIDGQKFYAGSSARNIFMRDFDLRKRRKKESKPDTTCQRLYAHMLRVKEAQKLSRDTLLLPQDFMTTYILTVKKDAVPEGKTIRCWLPYVRAYPFLSGATMIEADPPKYVLAPPEYPHRTVYMEKTAQKDADTRFMIRFIFRCWARANTINPADVQPYRKDAPDYQYYTAEHKPHNDLNNDLLKKLNAEIVGGETNPYTAARRIYDWMTKNLIYQFAREYSTLENISLYTASGRAGDCGQHSMLFMTLCRMNGIPARWQSGWEMFEAGGNNMHDWNEIYIEPFGWIPVDADMAINIALYSDDLLDTTQSKELADWMFGNMDHFRMAVNSDWGAPLYPPKNDFRSETVDFQRGEVEYDNHNLYFDKWSWDMDIQPITAEQAMELTRKIIPPP
ncbi:MAG: transglutaminase domain-containing protein, partial [bacterium]